jgi:hypothetical protein
MKAPEGCHLDQAKYLLRCLLTTKDCGLRLGGSEGADDLIGYVDACGRSQLFVRRLQSSFCPAFGDPQYIITFHVEVQQLCDIHCALNNPVRRATIDGWASVLKSAEALNILEVFVCDISPKDHHRFPEFQHLALRCDNHGNRHYAAELCSTVSYR